MNISKLMTQVMMKNTSRAMISTFWTLPGPHPTSAHQEITTMLNMGLTTSLPSRIYVLQFLLDMQIRHEST